MNNPFEKIDDRLNNIECLLAELKHSQNRNFNNCVDELLTIKQAAVLLTLTTPTIYGLVQRREIPFSKRGKRLYFSKKELLEWVAEGRKKTVSEINSYAFANLNNKRR